MGTDAGKEAVKFWNNAGKVGKRWIVGLICFGIGLLVGWYFL